MQKQFITCKDCKHRYTENCALYYGTAYQDGKETKYFCGNSTDDNFYCAKGELNDETELQAVVCKKKRNGTKA